MFQIELERSLDRSSGHPPPESKRHTITRIDVAEPTRTSAIDPGDCEGGHDLQVSRSGTLLCVG